MSFPLVLALFFTVGWVPVYRYRTELLFEAYPNYEGAERSSGPLSLIILSLHVTAGCILTSLANIPPMAVLMSVLLYLMGIGLWLWGRSLLAPLNARLLPQEAPEGLRRDGAYGLVRHPLYLGTLVAASAPVVATRSWVLLVTLVCCFLCARQTCHR